MSTGGIVGIAAGVLLGIAALLLIAGALWVRDIRQGQFQTDHDLIAPDMPRAETQEP
jgi:hypothetical protein